MPVVLKELQLSCAHREHATQQEPVDVVNRWRRSMRSTVMIEALFIVEEVFFKVDISALLDPVDYWVALVSLLKEQRYNREVVLRFILCFVLVVDVQL